MVGHAYWRIIRLHETCNILKNAAQCHHTLEDAELEVGETKNFDDQVSSAKYFKVSVGSLAAIEAFP